MFYCDDWGLSGDPEHWDGDFVYLNRLSSSCEFQPIENIVIGKTTIPKDCGQFQTFCGEVEKYTRANFRGWLNPSPKIRDERNAYAMSRLLS